MPLVSHFAERFRHMMVSRYLMFGVVLYRLQTREGSGIVLYLYPYMTWYPYTSYLVDHRSHQPNQMMTNIDLLILRDRTDGRSAGNPHVSKACNCLVSQTKSIPTGTRPCSLAQLATTLLIMFLPCIIAMCLRLHPAHSTSQHSK